MLILSLDSATDVQALTSESDDIIPSLLPAFERYNERQLTTVKLPGSSQEVCAIDYLLGGDADLHTAGRSLSVNLTRWKATGTLTQRAKLRSKSTILHRYAAKMRAGALRWKLTGRLDCLGRTISTIGISECRPDVGGNHICYFRSCH